MNKPNKSDFLTLCSVQDLASTHLHTYRMQTVLLHMNETETAEGVQSLTISLVSDDHNGSVSLAERSVAVLGSPW